MEDHRVHLLLGLEHDEVFDCLVGQRVPTLQHRTVKALKYFVLYVTQTGSEEQVQLLCRLL